LPLLFAAYKKIGDFDLTIFTTQNTMINNALSSWFVLTTVAHFWCGNTSIMGGLLVGAAPTGSMTIDVTVHDDDPLKSRGRNSSPRTTSAQVGIENEDLFDMLNFTLNVRSSSTARASKSSVTNQVMYVKTESTKRTSANGLEEVVWRGITETSHDDGSGDESTMGFATILMRYDTEASSSSKEDSTFVAFLSTNTTIYDIGRLWNGTLSVKTMLLSEAKDGMGIEAPDKPLEPNVATSRFQVAGSIQPEYTSDTMETSSGSQSLLQQYPIKEEKEDEDRGRSLQSNSKVIVDVLVCVTNRAMCQVAGLNAGCAFSEANRKPVTDKIALAFEVTNQAMRGVGVPVEVRMVRVLYFANGDANPDGEALNFLRNDPVVQKQMRDVGADLVTMFTGSVPAGFPAAGIAYLNAAESVNSVDYLSDYVFTHEIGT
jgi:hypothetical protein